MKPTQFLFKHLIRTIINPSTKYTPLQTLNSLPFTPRSFLYIPNTRTSPIAIESLQHITKSSPNLQIITAVLDSIHQDSITELWFDDFIEINSGKSTGSLEDSIQQGSITLRIGEEKIKVPLVRTTGFTPYDYTLFCHDSGEIQSLSELDVSLPLNNIGALTHSNVGPISNWVEMTSYLDNVITKIDGKPASFALVDALKNSGLGGKLQRLFLEVRSSGINRYEIIAGGGEYGSRSEMLVIDSESLPQDEKIMCRFCVSVGDANVEGLTYGITVEQINDENRVVDKGVDMVMDGYMRIGCEQGFKYNDFNYKASNDAVNIEVEEI